MANKIVKFFKQLFGGCLPSKSKKSRSAKLEIDEIVMLPTTRQVCFEEVAAVIPTAGKIAVMPAPVMKRVECAKLSSATVVQVGVTDSVPFHDVVSTLPAPLFSPTEVQATPVQVIKADDALSVPPRRPVADGNGDAKPSARSVSLLVRKFESLMTTKPSALSDSPPPVNPSASGPLSDTNPPPSDPHQSDHKAPASDPQQTDISSSETTLSS